MNFDCESRVEQLPSSMWVADLDVYEGLLL